MTATPRAVAAAPGHLSTLLPLGPASLPREFSEQQSDRAGDWLSTAFPLRYGHSMHANLGGKLGLGESQSLSGSLHFGRCHMLHDVTLTLIVIGALTACQEGFFVAALARRPSDAGNAGALNDRISPPVRPIKPRRSHVPAGARAHGSPGETCARILKGLSLGWALP